ncbi:MAG: hypothetical protein H0W69_00965 [Gemmatimonadaceae bacterium]|nr:hypothetical protein [Gemmatimonadaceae bacterium]
MKRYVIAAAFSVLPAVAAAQGNLSTQGLGYPAGDLSARSSALGGGNAEFDAQSTVNDASVANWITPVLYVQYQPEFRKVTLGSSSSNTLTSRFPLIGTAMAVGSRAAIALTSTNFLDRSASAVTSLNDTIAGDPVSGSETFRTLGGINDVRFAAAYRPNGALRVGIAGHAFTGQNRIISQVTFGDSSSFIPLSQQSVLAYTGAAVSGGFELRIRDILAISASGRKGGFLNMRSGDSLVASAKVPDRFGGSVQFTGISGLNVSGRVSRDLWTALQPLGTKLTTFDAWDGGVGAEATASRSQSRLLQLRVGARYRGLPFGVQGEQVHEFSFGGGVGLQFARDRAQIDAGLNRGSRFTGTFSARGAAVENAYTVSVGLRVRP